MRENRSVGCVNSVCVKFKKKTVAHLLCVLLGRILLRGDNITLIMQAGGGGGSTADKQ